MKYDCHYLYDFYGIYIHGQLQGCNMNLRPKAAVAKVFHDKEGPLICFIRYVQITTYL